MINPYFSAPQVFNEPKTVTPIITQKFQGPSKLQPYAEGGSQKIVKHMSWNINFRPNQKLPIKTW